MVSNLFRVRFCARRAQKRTPKDKIHLAAAGQKPLEMNNRVADVTDTDNSNVQE
jgi:hypothetical protein